jgi:ribose transport system permease protein
MNAISNNFSTIQPPHLPAQGWLSRHRIPLALVVISTLAYAATAIGTGQMTQLTLAGVMGLLQRMVALGLVALGQNFVMLAGSIDLSVANLVSVSAVLGAYFMQGDAGLILPAVGGVLLIAGLVGAINGVLVARLGISPLIATLSTGLVMQGVLTVAFTSMEGAIPKAFQWLAYGDWGGVPIAVALLAIVAGASAWTLRRTVAGYRLYAVGGNAQTARLAGIRTARVVVGAHVAASVMCGMAGLYLASWLGAGTPWVGRDGGYDLGSIAVVVIGGTLLSGGKGGVSGTMAGVYTFSVIDAVFNMLQIDPFLSQVLSGAIVVAAVGATTFGQKDHVA